MTKQPKLKLRETALSITRWVGSLQSIVVHTFLFLACFGAVVTGVLQFDRMLLVLTTVVSLEAIYLSIFIQMTINYTTAHLEEVGQDIDEIQEDIGEIQEDVDEIQEDVDEIQEDVDELQEDIEEIAEDDKEGDALAAAHEKRLQDIHAVLQRLTSEIERMQK